MLHRETDCVISAGGYLDDSCLHWSISSSLLFMRVLKHYWWCKRAHHVGDTGASCHTLDIAVDFESNSYYTNVFVPKVVYINKHLVQKLNVKSYALYYIMADICNMLHLVQKLVLNYLHYIMAHFFVISVTLWKCNSANTMNYLKCTLK